MATSNVSGSFGPTAVTVTRILNPNVVPLGPQVDCGTTDCIVDAYDQSGAPKISHQHITFAAMAPPPGASAPTGQRAQALKRCRKKFAKGTKARKRCVRKANKLPL